MSRLQLYKNYPNLFWAKATVMAGHLLIGLNGWVFGNHKTSSLVFSSVFLFIGISAGIGLLQSNSKMIRAVEVVGFTWNVFFLILVYLSILFARVQAGVLPQATANLIIIFWTIWTLLHLIVLRAPDFEGGRE